MRLSRTSALVLAAALVAGFQTSAQAELIYGLNTAGNNIFTFDSLNPSKILSAKFVSGLVTNEELLTIDSRPLGGGLYSVSSLGNLYTINAGTGALTLVGTITGGTATMNGVNFASDFNPTVDLLRFGSDTTMNIRINPTTGATAGTDTYFNYANGAIPNIVGLAYTNNFAGATSTTLYGIDSTSNTLVTVIPPNSGTLNTVGGLGVDLTAVNGFDISNTTIAYAANEQISNSISQLFTINLVTGFATPLGTIGGGFQVRDITLVSGGGVQGPGPIVPEPASIAILALGATALLARRRRA